MKKFLAIFLTVLLLLGSTTGVMAKPTKANKKAVDPQLEVSRYAFEYAVPESIVAGGEVKAELSLKTAELGKEGYEGVRLVFSVTSDVLDEEDEVLFIGRDKEGKTYTFRLGDGEIGTWGPAVFSIAAKYQETTPWTLKFPKPGKYEITFKLINTKEKGLPSILEKTEKLTVEPVVLKGFVYEKNISGTFYGIDGYRLTGDFDFRDYEDDFLVVEGYPDLRPSIYQVKSLYVNKVTRVDDWEEVILQGKIQKVTANNVYYTLEGCRLLETNNYDNQDFDNYYDDQVEVKVKGQVDEVKQGISVTLVSVIGDNGSNKDKKDKDDDEDKDEDENDSKGNGNVHGLLNALENHLKKSGNEKSKSTQRLMELLQTRMGADEFEEALEKMEKAINIETDDEDYKILGKMYELKGKKYETYINGKKTEFDVLPMNKDGRTLVPFRKIAESLGADVSWNPEKNTVTVIKDNIKVELTIGDKKALVNDEEIIIDVPAEIFKNRTLIPLRFLAEKLDAAVDYYPEGSMIVVKNK